jgi:hypothetical protein
MCCSVHWLSACDMHYVNVLCQTTCVIKMDCARTCCAVLLLSNQKRFTRIPPAGFFVVTQAQSEGLRLFTFTNVTTSFCTAAIGRTIVPFDGIFGPVCRLLPGLTCLFNGVLRIPVVRVCNFPTLCAV